MQPVLQATKLNKSFHDPVTVKVLTDIGFIVNKGEFLAVTGRSGCGKSTLLYILSTMDTEYEGDLFINQENMRNKTALELAGIRNEKIGFVFQFHYLLNEFSVLDNVMIPGLKCNKYPEKELRQRAMDKLRMLGMEKAALKNASQLSGGEKQRVAIARALINDPLIVMGDEPTGNLDKKNSEIVYDIFYKLAAANQTLLIVTHDQNFAERNTTDNTDGRRENHQRRKNRALTLWIIPSNLLPPYTR